MKLACIYINALHFRDTVSFYEQLLQQKGKEVLHSDGWSFPAGIRLPCCMRNMMRNAYRKNRMWTNTIMMHMSKTAYRR